jgi:hypothetical protein
MLEQKINEIDNQRASTPDEMDQWVANHCKNESYDRVMFGGKFNMMNNSFNTVMNNQQVSANSGIIKASTILTPKIHQSASPIASNGMNSSGYIDFSQTTTDQFGNTNSVEISNSNIDPNSTVGISIN